jgi:hypothetical protein
VTREQFIVGKYLGLVMTLAVNLGAMCVAFYLVLFAMDLLAPHGTQGAAVGPVVDPRLMIAVVLIFGELMIITAVALFFSTFSSPFLSAMLTFALWVAGRFNADLRQFEQLVDSSVAGAIALGLYYLLPNLAPFDVKAEVVHGVPIAWSHVSLTLAYAGVYVSALLLAAMVIFRRRDFK